MKLYGIFDNDMVYCKNFQFISVHKVNFDDILVDSKWRMYECIQDHNITGKIKLLTTLQKLKGD